uniref:Uncharacterized protein n=1 Tax=Rhizophora mucronata TaxID=61149 RepID=A0A2P2QCS5_RHIMU
MRYISSKFWFQFSFTRNISSKFSFQFSFSIASVLTYIRLRCQLVKG